MRAGTRALSLLATPLNVDLLKVLSEESMPLGDLRHAVGSPPQTTFRGHLRTLAEMEILERTQEDKFPGRATLELTTSGCGLIRLASVVQGWLETAPVRPLSLGSAGSKSTLNALVEGWSSSLIRAFAARPLSLTELDRLIGGLNYPSLERRLSAMRSAGLLEPCREGRARPHKVTTWLRRAAGPLAAAALWERDQIPKAAGSLSRIDVEAIFLLAVPLVRLDQGSTGSCRLAVDVPGDSRSEPAGVLVEVRDGRIASCVARLEGGASGWAFGSRGAWLRALALGDLEELEIGGDVALVSRLAERLHVALFGAAREAMTPV